MRGLSPLDGDGKKWKNSKKLPLLAKNQAFASASAIEDVEFGSDLAILVWSARKGRGAFEA
jgi:hypothetical protein